MARSKAYLFKGVEIRWQCDPALIKEGDPTPAEAGLHYPGGLEDFLATSVEDRATIPPPPSPAMSPARTGSRCRRSPGQMTTMTAS